jgi:hypothetical protein
MSYREDKMFNNFIRRHKSVYEKKRVPIKIGDRVFESVSSAANYYGMLPGNMSNYIKKGHLSDGTPIVKLSK